MFDVKNEQVIIRCNLINLDNYFRVFIKETLVINFNSMNCKRCRMLVQAHK